MKTLRFNCRFAYPRGFSLDHSFEIESGITALVGPSGSGKTTTLHLIAGILKPDSGQIAVGEHLLFDSARKIDLPTHRRPIGLVFQDYQLFPHLNVLQNLGFSRAGWRSRKGLSDERFARLIDVLQLGDLLHRFPSTLSGGQRQRVALGRAIASDPAVLLLDEPVSALDESLKSTILDHIAETLAEFPIPTLLVTHDLATVRRINASVVQMSTAATSNLSRG